MAKNLKVGDRVRQYVKSLASFTRFDGVIYEVNEKRVVWVKWGGSTHFNLEHESQLIRLKKKKSVKLGREWMVCEFGSASGLSAIVSKEMTGSIAHTALYPKIIRVREVLE